MGFGAKKLKKLGPEPVLGGPEPVWGGPEPVWGGPEPVWGSKIGKKLKKHKKSLTVRKNGVKIEGLGAKNHYQALSSGILAKKLRNLEIEKFMGALLGAVCEEFDEIMTGFSEIVRL